MVLYCMCTIIYLSRMHALSKSVPSSPVCQCCMKIWTSQMLYRIKSRHIMESIKREILMTFPRLCTLTCWIPGACLAQWTPPVRVMYSGLCVGPVEEGGGEKITKGYSMAISSNNKYLPFLMIWLCALFHFCPSLILWLTFDIHPASITSN